MINVEMMDSGIVKITENKGTDKTMGKIKKIRDRLTLTKNDLIDWELKIDGKKIDLEVKDILDLDITDLNVDWQISFLFVRGW